MTSRKRNTKRFCYNFLVDKEFKAIQMCLGQAVNMLDSDSIQILRSQSFLETNS